MAAAAGCTAPPAMAEASCTQHQQAGVEHVKAQLLGEERFGQKILKILWLLFQELFVSSLTSRGLMLHGINEGKFTLTRWCGAWTHSSSSDDTVHEKNNPMFLNWNRRWSTKPFLRGLSI